MTAEKPRRTKPPLPTRRSERPAAAVEIPRAPKLPSTTPAPARSESIVRPDFDLPTIGSNDLWSKKIRTTEEIDRGGMSYVVRGKDLTLHRQLALKVSPLPRMEMPPGQLARFIEEAQIAAQLEHPNVVPVHELGLDPEGRAYFSMKLVGGQSLEKILELKKSGDAQTTHEFGLRRLLDVFLQVCQAVEYAHARGVVHRDLKPSNVMVGDFGEVLVMDWGVAKLLNDESVATEVETAMLTAEGNAASSGSRRPGSIAPARRSDVTSFRSGKEALTTQAGQLVGTPAYMSPEQARGAAVDERSDLYSLGVMLYEILCGQLPFDDDEPRRLLERVTKEKPRPPSEIARSTPLALETLALRLLEKDPARRALPIAQIRAHIQDYIEGIAREYRRDSLWTNALWTLGGLSLFAFLVWYLTGQSIRALFALAPATVFNAFGWFLLILALGAPLWSAYLALRLRSDRDRFGPPSDEERFVSGYLARRTFATALSPVLQLIFIAELAGLAIARVARHEVSSAETVQRISAELRAEWAHSLVVILVFLFLYSFFLSSEVRFARKIDRYDALLARPRWEAVWPVFLIALILSTIGTTQVLDWVLGNQGNFSAFLRQQMLAQPVDLVEAGKTVVFQGTFLSVLSLLMLLLAFPPAEVLAALRLSYQPADEATIQHRAQYWVRSIAILRVARTNWLYGGTMIGALSAMTILSRPVAVPFVHQVIYILGPSLIGILGYALTRRHLTRILENAPPVARLLERQVAEFKQDVARIRREHARESSWRHRLLELAVPVGCIVLYSVWTGSGIQQRALQQLVMPVTTKGWLLILPYVLLLFVIPFRDRWLAREGRGVANSPEGS